MLVCALESQLPSPTRYGAVKSGSSSGVKLRPAARNASIKLRGAAAGSSLPKRTTLSPTARAVVIDTKVTVRGPGQPGHVGPGFVMSSTSSMAGSQSNR